MGKVQTGVVAAALLVAAACGDDTDGRLSNDEFSEQACAIYERTGAALDDAGQDAFGSGDPTDDDIRSFVEDRVTPIVEDQIADWRQLRPPSDLDEDWGRFLEDNQAALDELQELARDNPDAVLSGDPDPFAELESAAHELGLECE